MSLLVWLLSIYGNENRNPCMTQWFLSFLGLLAGKIGGEKLCLFGIIGKFAGAGI